ncbi:basal body-orientation factor 1 [Brachionichthys hirsutus]|uniref:basal body-orientation factor 1 n=1 Tax=Brachionichthys hirsutus TaxID=412623 RepID=UPI003604BF7A
MPKKKVTKIKKAKVGKWKKENRQVSKVSDKARGSAALWELRLRITDQSLAQYTEACQKLARANEELTNQLCQQEKDTIDMTAFLKREDAAKEEKIGMLHESLQRQEAHARDKQNKLIEECTRQIKEMQDLFRKKSSDFSMIQEGMRTIKEFQKTKAQLEQELSNTRDSMEVAEKEHRENLNKMEVKFFKEKARLEGEAEQKIALVMERAHNEAVVQLDDASHSVFKENVCLKEALKYHTKEAEELQKLTNSLAKENASLVLDKNTFEMMVKENVTQMKVQKEQLSKLRAKVASLEKIQELKPGESDRAKEEEKKKEKARSPRLGIQVELERLQKVIAMRESELRYIKRLSSAIVRQRTELELFFHEALAQVKQEIRTSRLQYKKEAQQAYGRRLREATAGKIKFPPIRTFHKIHHSTNSVHSDMEAASRWTHQPGSKVEMSDLTWEQREQVLWLLFAKMNGQRERKAGQHLALSASNKKELLTDKLKRTSPSRPSSPRRLSPSCRRTYTACQTQGPHDLCVWRRRDNLDRLPPLRVSPLPRCSPSIMDYRIMKNVLQKYSAMQAVAHSKHPSKEKGLCSNRVQSGCCKC